MSREVRLSLAFLIVPLCLCLLGCQPKATVPNVVGMQQFAAEAAITSARFVVGTVTPHQQTLTWRISCLIR